MKDLSFYLREAERLLPHRSKDEREEWARHCVDTHPGFGRKIEPVTNEPEARPWEPQPATVAPPVEDIIRGTVAALSESGQERHEKLMNELAAIKRAREVETAKNFTLAFRVGILLCLLFLCAKAAHCQTTIRVTDMVTGITVAPGDSEHKAIRVICITGCSGGSGGGGTSSDFGAAFPSSGTAAGFISASGTMAGGTLDASGYLKVNVAAGSGGNGAASNTGAAVPAQAGYTGINVGGTLRGVTGTNPSGSIYAMQVDGSSVTQPVSGTFWQATQPVSAAALPLPAGAATSAKQPALGVAGTASVDVITVQGIASMTPLAVSQSGTWNIGTVTAVTAITNALPAGSNVIGHVIVDSGSTSAVTIADGADVTQGAKADARSTATDTTSITIMSVLKEISFMEQNPASRAVTNAGTFAVQATLTAETTKVIGVVRTADGSGNLLTSTGNALDVNLKTSAASNLSTNIAQINGVTPLMGNGVTGTGSLRVTVASDNTAFSVNAAQSGTWNITNISGTVSLPTGAATVAKQPALGTAGTASADVITIQGIASMTKLLVTPDANSAINVAQINGVTPLMGNGTTGTGSQRVTIASDNTAFSVNAIESGTWTVQPGNTANTTPWLAAPAAEATTANSALTSYTAAAASTNSTSVKGSAGNVYGYSLTNTTSTLYYLRMYNSSSAPTCSSATGFVETITIPANTSGAGREIWPHVPQGFTTGIGFCITGGSGSTDNTNAATGVFARILYK